MTAILLKLAALQAALITILLFKKKGNWKANISLATLVLLIGFTCLLNSFHTLEFYIDYPHFIRLDWGIPLLFGPLVWYYSALLTSDPSVSYRKLLILFAPYLTNLIVLIPFFMQSGEEKILGLDYFTANIASGTDQYSSYNIFLRSAISVSNIGFAIYSIDTFRKYIQGIRNEFSNIDSVQLRWLKQFLIGFLVLSFFFLIVSILMVQDKYPDFDYDQYYYLTCFLLIYILSYKALSQPEILLKPLIVSSNQPTFSTDKWSTEIKTLTELMVNEKIYLKPDLTASELSSELNLSRHQLSELLSKGLSTNFYDFVNNYRIEEFKSRVASKKHKHLTILAIAYESGFNSKTTFNGFFKKTEGMTPRAFSKLHE